jgi:hypothetical protein
LSCACKAIAEVDSAADIGGVADVDVEGDAD